MWNDYAMESDQGDIDELDSKILAETACVAYTIELYSKVYYEMLVKQRWYQFWREVKTPEEVIALVTRYSELGKSDPDYKPGAWTSKNWIIEDVYAAVASSKSTINNLRKQRSQRGVK